MLYYYYDVSYFLCATIISIITMYAYLKVKFVFKKYSAVACHKKVTGFFISESVLLQNNVDSVSIEYFKGSNGDHFDLRYNKINLSESTYFGNDVTSAGIAAHEAGHAVQYANGYAFIKLREKLFPVTKICSVISMPLVIFGLLLPIQFSFVVNLGILLFTIVVLFHLITLPVEIDASRRAIYALERSGYLSPSEMSGVKEVLKAAAFTYIASLFTSFITLLRLIFISSKRKNE